MNRYSAKAAATIAAIPLALGVTGATVASCNPDPGTTTTTTTASPSTVATTTSTVPSPSPQLMSPCPPNPGGINTNAVKLLTPDGSLDSDTLTNDPTPAFTISGDGGNATYGAAIDGHSLGQWKTCSVSTAAVGVQGSAVEDGTHTFTASELSPGFGPIAPLKFTVDTAPPAPPTITGSQMGAGKVRLFGTADATAVSVQVYDGLRVVGGAGVTTGTWTATTLTLTSGPHTLSVGAFDQAGNRSTLTTIDLTLP